MPKKSKTKRIIKIIGGIIIFFTLPSLLFFGFLYLKYNEDLPQGIEGPQADQLATQMLEALNEEAYLNTDYLEWTFKGRHHYKWYKSDKTCEVSWDDMTVILDLENHDNSKVFARQQEYNGKEKHDYIHKAENYFNNDSFWLVAPYKVFDKGVERRLVKTEDDKDALLVTYTSGGSTPGDSYLWHFDELGKPKSFQMWVDILPIDGIEATWDNWITTESGAILPTSHKLLFLNLEIGDVKSTPKEKKTYYYPNEEFIKSNSDHVAVNLDTLNTFGQLAKSIIKNCTASKSTLISFTTSAYDFSLLTQYNCASNDIICYKKRNILEIKNETVIHSAIENKPIDSLYKYLKIQATNEGKLPKFSSAKNIVVIHFSQDSLTPIQQTKKILKTVFNNYNNLKKELNDSIILQLDVTDRLITEFPIPPPPPAAPMTIELIE